MGKSILSILALTAAALFSVAGLIPMQAAALTKSQRRACWVAREGYAECNAHIVDDSDTGKPLASTSYSSGLTPADLHSAYNLGTLPAAGSNFAWNGQTVAIVDAYDDPNAAADLLAYRKQFKLPLCQTTATNPTTNDLVGCVFSKVNQNGTTSPMPAGNTGWGQEISLDVDMVAAICPNCKILLVEATTNSFSNLSAAVDRAAAMGANVISNSYGGNEFSGETSSTYNGHYNHPGIAITVSAGDSGYGTEFPASSQYVTAVGGTSLTKSSNSRGWSETVWNGTGSGCSAYVGKLAWQPTIGSCTKRIVSDVSAVADPSTGVAVYDSYGSTGGSNWYVIGGTSASAPIIGAVYALAGNAGGNSPEITYGEYPYTHKSSFFDITSGTNGRCTRGQNSSNLALCTAVAGFDGPTGLGSPNGISGF